MEKEIKQEVGKQEFIYSAYQELADKGNWESSHYQLVLIKGGMKIKDKVSGREVTMMIVN